MVEREDWLIVEAKRDDGTPTMFRIRELAPRPELAKIFVVELPYPMTELSRLPGALDYRRLAEFEEQWLRPACNTLGWELVGSKTEDGSFFLYMYGSSDPSTMIEKLSPFDAALGFYDDDDPDWQEYGTLRELLDQAKALPPVGLEPEPAPKRDRRAATNAERQPTVVILSKNALMKARAKPIANAPPRRKAKAKPTAKAPPRPKAKAKPRPAKLKAKRRPTKRKRR
jgi:hypothetical protein